MSVLVSGWGRGYVGVEQYFKKTLKISCFDVVVCGCRGLVSIWFTLQVMLFMVRGRVVS